MVAKELKEVLALLQPVVAPIAGFAYTVVGGVSTTVLEIAEVRAAAGGVLAGVAGIVGPIGALVSAL